MSARECVCVWGGGEIPIDYSLRIKSAKQVEINTLFNPSQALIAYVKQEPTTNTETLTLLQLNLARIPL